MASDGFLSKWLRLVGRRVARCPWHVPRAGESDADWLRIVFDAEGSLPEVVRRQCERWAADGDAL